MSFKAPQEFDFSMPGNWPAWRDRWQRFKLAAKLHKETQEVQVSALIYSMGPTAEHLLTSFALTAEEKKKIDPVIKEFDSYFQPKTNTIAERHAFETRNQKQGESNESFIRTLLTMAEKCAFGGTRQERIRDRLISGMLNKELSRKIQIQALENELTLDKVIAMLRSCDIVDQASHEHAEADGVSKHSSQPRSQPPRPQNQQRQQPNRQQHQHPSRQQHQQPQQRLQQRQGQFQRQQPRSQHFTSREHQQRSHPSQLTCRYCGRARHQVPRDCPALGATCFACGGRDHFQFVCSRRQPSSVQEVQVPDEEYFLGDVDAPEQGNMGV